MSENPLLVVPCPGCGRMSAGNFCTHCGANLRQSPQKDKDPFIAFATGFLNLKNIWRYFRLYFKILSSPVVNTIKIYNEISFESSIKFMEVSVAFYTMVTASKLVFITLGEHLLKQTLWKEIFSEILYLVFVAGGYFITLKLFYRFASKRWGKKNKHDYVKMYCLFAGFLLPLSGILYYISGGPVATLSANPSVVFFIVRVILNLALAIGSLFYSFHIWQYFWGGPGNRVLAMLLLAGLVSLVTGFAVLVIIFASLNIDF
jgi:hypothetical protein